MLITKVFIYLTASPESSNKKWYKIPGTPGNKNDINIKEIGEFSFDEVSILEDCIEFRATLIIYNLIEAQKEVLKSKLVKIFKNHGFKVKELDIKHQEIDVTNLIKSNLAETEDTKFRSLL